MTTKTTKNVRRFKPDGYENWLTIKEVADACKRDVSWIRRLEARGDIPKARRVKVGKLKIRLWPEHELTEIKEVLESLHPGRPRGR